MKEMVYLGTLPNGYISACTKYCYQMEDIL